MALYQLTFFPATPCFIFHKVTLIHASKQLQISTLCASIAPDTNPVHSSITPREDLKVAAERRVSLSTSDFPGFIILGCWDLFSTGPGHR